MAFNNFKKRLAEKIIGGKIVKSVPDLSLTGIASELIGSSVRYTSLNSFKQLEEEYRVNPVLSSVINLRADYLSNAQIHIRNIITGEIITKKDFLRSKAKDKVVSNMFNLINNPNPLQSTKEFFALASIFKDVFGNSYIYGNSATNNVNIRDIAHMWCVWPQYMKPIVNDKYFDATSIDSIIANWKWQWGTYEKNFTNSEILHRKEPNIKLLTTNDLVLGESRQLSLQWPLSNIRIAYESRNVIANERGMRAIISSNKNDAHLDSVPMEDEEKTEVQEDLRTNYGFKKGQNQFMVTRHNVQVHHIDQDVRKLGLINEIASDAMIVAERYGMPEVLVKLYLKGATFENQESSERRMYQNTTIPEAKDNIEDLNVWLKCRDFNYEYVVSFDHIPVLQENEKDRSEINRNVNIIHEKLFFSGAITYNAWLQALKLPVIDEPWAKLRITEMKQEDIEIIRGNWTINKSVDEENN